MRVSTPGFGAAGSNPNTTDRTFVDAILGWRWTLA
jgi:hypothetical protein